MKLDLIGAAASAQVADSFEDVIFPSHYYSQLLPPFQTASDAVRNERLLLVGDQGRYLWSI